VAPALTALAVVTLWPLESSTQQWALTGAASAFLVLGLADDLWGIPTRYRFILQLGIALGSAPLLANGSSWGWHTPLVLILSVGWLVSYVNAFNFMDGINGISVAQVLVAGMAWFLIGNTRQLSFFSTGGLLVAAVAVGFAPFNFPNAHVFLGDAGSYFFGAWLGVLALVGLGMGLTPEAVLAPLCLYLSDTGTTLVRRILRREKWFTPHRGHVYQRLVAKGWSHTRTTTLVLILMSTCSVFGALTLSEANFTRAIADIGIAVVLGAYLFAPRILASYQAPK
jgi:UDP-GlcNAc:undecaprenyl-phosphate GlcNAc-1-phosphate transferase